MKRVSAAHMSADEFRSAGHALVDRIAELFETLPSRPVTPGWDATAARQVIGAPRPLPEAGAPAGELVRSATESVIEGSLYNAHPRFFGYITAGSAPVGVLGELLAAAVNPNVGGHALSPVATEIEVETVRWIAELIGFPPGGSGLLTSGGNMANLTAFWAARTRMLGAGIRTSGLRGAAQPRVYVSAETHTWVQKAADLSGMGTEAVRWIPTDDSLRVDLSALRAAIAQDRARGDLPFMIVGTAGSVSTGAIDPLPALAELAKEEGLWFHVDGAYGAFAAALPEADEDLLGIRLADSVALDPHKWLYAPLDAGCVLVRDVQTLRDTYSYHPPYYRFDPDTTNYVDLGPENSRRFRALKVWLQLQQMGREGVVECIAEDCALARTIHQQAGEHPDLETYTRSLSIATFRFVPPDLRTRLGEPDVEATLNELNEQILAAVNHDGRAFLSNAVVRGRFLLRACVVNFRTGTEDCQALVDEVARVGRNLWAEASVTLA
ncbi:MAG: aminotransferase class V-fold PLP-dependent enzyme [Gemmatimonadota bacterium]